MGKAGDGARSPGAGPIVALLLVAGALLVTAVTLEALLRLLPSEVRGYDLSGRRFVHPREFERDRAKNRLGYHDIEWDPGTPERRRLFLLGDSYVEASSVPIPRTVGRQLERCLNERAPGRPYEVISIGHSAWGQARELEALRELAPEFRPDVVVTLFLSLNDVLDDSAELRRRQQEITTLLLHHRPAWISLRFDDAPGLFLERSALNRFLSFRLALAEAHLAAVSGGEASIPVAYLVYREDYDVAWSEAWRLEEELIATTRQYVSEIGARYLMVSASTPQGVLGEQRGLAELQRSYPAMREFAWDLDKPDRLLSEICQRLNIPVLLLEPIFRASVRDGHQLHWSYDGHWNEEGNREAGEEIARFVLAHEPEERAVLSARRAGSISGAPRP